MSTTFRTAFRAAFCLFFVCLANGRSENGQKRDGVACQDDPVPDSCGFPPSVTCSDLVGMQDNIAAYCDIDWNDYMCGDSPLENIKDTCRSSCNNCPEESAEGSNEESGEKDVTWNQKVCGKGGLGGKNWKYYKLQRFTNDDHGDVCRHKDWPENRNWRCPKGCFKVMDGPTNGHADKPFCVGKDKKACRV